MDASLEEIQPAVLPPTTGGANRRGGRQTKMKPKPKSKPKPKAIQKPKQKTKSKEMETAAKTGTTEAPDTAAAKNLSLAHGGSSKEGEDGETPRRGGEAVATSDDDSAHSEDDEEEKNGKDDADWVAPSAREPIESSLGEDAAEEVEQVKHHLACQERGNLADVPSRPGNEQADSSPAARTRKRTASQLAAGGDASPSTRKRRTVETPKQVRVSEKTSDVPSSLPAVRNVRSGGAKAPPRGKDRTPPARRRPSIVAGTPAAPGPATVLPGSTAIPSAGPIAVPAAATVDLSVVLEHLRSMAGDMKGMKDTLDKVDNLAADVSEMKTQIGGIVMHNATAGAYPGLVAHSDLSNKDKKKKKGTTAAKQKASVADGEGESDEGGPALPAGGAEPSSDDEGEEGSSKPHPKYLKKMKETVPHVRRALSFNNLYFVLARVTLQSVLDKVESEGGENTPLKLSPAGFVRFFSTILFSVRPSQTKDVFSDGVGADALDFRYGVLALWLFLSQDNMFKCFRTPRPSSAETGQGEGADPTAAQKKAAALPELPFWLKPDEDGNPYITDDDVMQIMEICRSAGKANDGYGDRRDIGLGQLEPEKRHIAYYVMDRAKVYLNQYLTLCRRYPGSAFLDPLGMAYTKWSAIKKVTVDQDSLKLSWIMPHDWNDIPGRDEIPLMEEFDNEDHLRINRARYEEFKKDRTEVALFVEHDVKVAPAGSNATKRHRSGVDAGKVCQEVNLMDVVLKVLHVFTFASKKGDPYLLLASMKESLHSIYVLAAAFRVVLSTVKSPKVHEPAGCSTPEAEITEEDASAIISRLVPSDALNLRIVWRLLCCVPAKALKTKNIDKDERVKMIKEKRAASNKLANNGGTTPGDEENTESEAPGSDNATGAAASKEGGPTSSQRSAEKRLEMLAKFGYRKE